jgi:hypothetical protein
MPTEEEKRERDLRMLMEKEPVIFAPQIIGMLYPELEGKIVIPMALPDQVGPDAPVDPDNPTPERGNPTGPTADPVIDNETGQDEPQPRGPAGPRMEESLLRQLAEASDGALEDALKTAGSRLLDRMASSPQQEELRARYGNVPVTHILSNLSASDRRLLGADGGDVWAGAFDSLAVRGKGWVRRFFLDQGVNSITADQKAAIVMDTLIQILRDTVAVAAYRPLNVGPNGCRVSEDMIMFALNQADRIDE